MSRTRLSLKGRPDEKRPNLREEGSQAPNSLSYCSRLLPLPVGTHVLHTALSREH